MQCNQFLKYKTKTIMFMFLLLVTSIQILSSSLQLQQIMILNSQKYAFIMKINDKLKFIQRFLKGFKFHTLSWYYVLYKVKNNQVKLNDSKCPFQTLQNTRELAGHSDGFLPDRRSEIFLGFLQIMKLNR